tara:strand:- start:58 stop:525 length:468 start_codon:yes stop_codon:yes gene_type:complete
MKDNTNKPNSPKKRSTRKTDNVEELPKHIFDLYKEAIEREVQREVQRIEDMHKSLNAELDKVKVDFENRIDVMRQSIENKLDDIDIAFRGNSKIGIFEQIRNMRKIIRIILLCILLLFGFRLFSTSLDEWWDEFLKDHGVRDKEVDVRPKIPDSS